VRDDEIGLMTRFTKTSIGTVHGPFDLLKPNFRFAEDSAVVLDRVRRWSGHGGPEPTTVLYHLLHVGQILRHELGVTDPAVICAGLLHDLHEAATGDVSRPMKLALREVEGAVPSSFDLVEQGCMASVDARFSRCTGLLKHEDVALADAMALGWDADRLFGPGTAVDWDCPKAASPLLGEPSVERYLSALERVGARHVRRP